MVNVDSEEKLFFHYSSHFFYWEACFNRTLTSLIGGQLTRGHMNRIYLVLFKVVWILY